MRTPGLPIESSNKWPKRGLRNSWEYSHHPVLVSKIKGRGKAGCVQSPMESWNTAQHSCWQLCRVFQNNLGVTTPIAAVKQMSNYRPCEWMAEPLGGMGEALPPDHLARHIFIDLIIVSAPLPRKVRAGRDCFVHIYIISSASSKSKLLVSMIRKALARDRSSTKRLPQQ